MVENFIKSNFLHAKNIVLCSLLLSIKKESPKIVVPFTFNDNFGDYLYINVGTSSRRTNDSSSVQ